MARLARVILCCLAGLAGGGCGEDAAVNGTTTSGGAGGADSGAASSSSSASSAGGGGGSVGPVWRLRISGVSVSPGTAEFIEIWNPTAATVDLDDYYLSDDSSYFRLAYGSPWSPGDPNSDFLVQFPAGTKLAPGDVIVLQA